MGTLAPDYDQRVRNARENAGMKQEELADELNEKLSLIRKIERGEMRPSEEVRGKLESALGVSLTEEVGGEDWEAEDSSGGYTVGDIIERKD
jgi:putative transcription factor